MRRFVQTAICCATRERRRPNKGIFSADDVTALVAMIGAVYERRSESAWVHSTSKAAQAAFRCIAAHSLAMSPSRRRPASIVSVIGHPQLMRR